MKLCHLVITRFCYRDYRGGRNPLEPRNLARRLRLLRLGSLETIHSQTDQDFDWIVLCDRALPAGPRSELESLLAVRERSHLLEFDPDWRFEGLQWLRPWIADDCDRVTTTVLDDDDLLYVGFVADVKEMVRRDHTVSDFFLSGCRHAVQWDLIAAPDAAFGYLKPWHRTYRGEAFPVSAGFSLSCPPSADCSVMQFKHERSPFYFGTAPRSEISPDDSRRLRSALALDSSSWQDWRSMDRFRWLESDTAPQAVMVNHFGNVQVGRLFEEADQRQPLTSLDGFPSQFAVREAALRACLEDARPTLATFRDTLASSWSLARTQVSGGWLRRLRFAARFARQNSIGLWRLMRATR